MLLSPITCTLSVERLSCDGRCRKFVREAADPDDVLDITGSGFGGRGGGVVTARTAATFSGTAHSEAG